MFRKKNPLYIVCIVHCMHGNSGVFMGGRWYSAMSHFWYDANKFSFFYCLSSAQFGQLFLSELVKTVATSCRILRSKNAPNRFRLEIHLKPCCRS